MAYDVLIKNGRVIDGSGMRVVPWRCRGQGRQDRRDRQIVGRCRRRSSMSAVRRSPRALSTITAIMTPRSPGIRCARSRATTARPASLSAIARCRWRRCARARPNAWPSSSSYVEAIPMEVLEHHRGRLGNLPAIHGQARQESRGQCRHADRPHRGALLRDGRRVPEAHRDRRRTQGNAGGRARRHGRRRARPVGIAQPAAITTRRACTSRRCGRTRRRSSRSPTCCARWAPASSNRAAAATPR